MSAWYRRPPSMNTSEAGSAVYPSPGVPPSGRSNSGGRQCHGLEAPPSAVRPCATPHAPGRAGKPATCAMPKSPSTGRPPRAPKNTLPACTSRCTTGRRSACAPASVSASAAITTSTRSTSPRYVSAHTPPRPSSRHMACGWYGSTTHGRPAAGRRRAPPEAPPEKSSTRGTPGTPARSRARSARTSRSSRQRCSAAPVSGPSSTRRSRAVRGGVHSRTPAAAAPASGG